MVVDLFVGLVAEAAIKFFHRCQLARSSRAIYISGWKEIDRVSIESSGRYQLRYSRFGFGGCPVSEGRFVEWS